METANHLQEEMLKEANNQTEHLKKMIQAHEDVLLELRNVLAEYEESSCKKVYEHESIANLHVRNLPMAFSKVLRDLEAEISHLKGRIGPVCLFFSCQIVCYVSCICCYASGQKGGWEKSGLAPPGHQSPGLKEVSAQGKLLMPLANGQSQAGVRSSFSHWPLALTLGLGKQEIQSASTRQI